MKLVSGLYDIHDLPFQLFGRSRNLGNSLMEIYIETISGFYLYAFQSFFAQSIFKFLLNKLYTFQVLVVLWFG